MKELYKLIVALLVATSLVACSDRDPDECDPGPDVDAILNDLRGLGLDARAEARAVPYYKVFAEKLAEIRARFDLLGYPQDESLVQLFDRVAQDGGFVAGDAVLAGG